MRYYFVLQCDKKFIFGESLLNSERSNSCVTTKEMVAKLSCATAEEEHIKQQNIFSDEDTQMVSSNTSGYSCAQQEQLCDISSDKCFKPHPKTQ